MVGVQLAAVSCSDRTRNLETLMAALQRHTGGKVIVFYQPEHVPKLQGLEARFTLFRKIAFPVGSETVEHALKDALAKA